MKKIYILLIFIIPTLLRASADSSSTDYLDSICTDFGRAFEDAGYLYDATLNMSGEDLLIGAAAIGGAGLVMLADNDIRELLKRNKMPLSKNTMNNISEFGDIRTVEIVAGAMYLYGLFADDAYHRTTARMSFESLILSGSLAMAIRFTLGRCRPELERGPDKFLMFEGTVFKGGDLHQSFPSGHITVAMAFATVLAHRTESYWLKSAYFSAVGITAACRVMIDFHWTSDVLFGAALGYLSGKLICDAEDARQDGKYGSGLKIIPTATGVGIHYGF